jgi:hypothetical protein
VGHQTWFDDLHRNPQAQHIEEDGADAASARIMCGDDDGLIRLPSGTCWRWLPG